MDEYAVKVGMTYDFAKRLCRPTGRNGFRGAFWLYLTGIVRCSANAASGSPACSGGNEAINIPSII